MIVDDNPTNLKLLEDMLLQQGHEVRSFPLGRLALAAATQRPPDLILLDITMPEMSGFEVCERLKADKKLREIPVIFLSALNETQDKVRAFVSGGVDYITKPFEFEEVEARVETHLQLRRAHQVERDLLESQLNQARRLELIGQLSAGVMHEIKTPAQFIGDNGKFLEDSFRDLLTVLQCSEKIASSQNDEELLARLAELGPALKNVDIDYVCEEIPRAIRQLLEGVETIARIVGSMKEISHPGQEEKTMAEIRRIIESAVLVSRSEWKYCAEVITDFESELMVPCLAGELTQVIVNLMVNAAHAISDVVEGTGAQGTITISVRRNGSFAEIRVRDTGTGIPEAARQHVFDPFFTTKDVGKGTGQGLALAHSVIVQKHGGKVAFETEMGVGTTFIIQVPLEPSASPDGLSSGPEPLRAKPDPLHASA
jgi:signal transduction histidine kinase